MAPSIPPPSGVYVPAVLFFDENEEFDVPAIKSHVLRLAKVSAKQRVVRSEYDVGTAGRCNWDPRSRQ